MYLYFMVLVNVCFWLRVKSLHDDIFKQALTQKATQSKCMWSYEYVENGPKSHCVIHVIYMLIIGRLSRQSKVCLSVCKIFQELLDWF